MALRWSRACGLVPRFRGRIRALQSVTGALPLTAARHGGRGPSGGACFPDSRVRCTHAAVATNPAHLVAPQTYEFVSWLRCSRTSPRHTFAPWLARLWRWSLRAVCSCSAFMTRCSTTAAPEWEADSCFSRQPRSPRSIRPITGRTSLPRRLSGAATIKRSVMPQKTRSASPGSVLLAGPLGGP